MQFVSASLILRYPDVVPQALKLLAAMFGAGHTMSDDFCAEKAS